jgi:hypothetical protein
MYHQILICKGLYVAIIGSQINNQVYWKNYTDQLVSKLSGARYAARCVLHISNTDILKSV